MNKIIGTHLSNGRPIACYKDLGYLEAMGQSDREFEIDKNGDTIAGFILDEYLETRGHRGGAVVRLIKLAETRNAVIVIKRENYFTNEKLDDLVIKNYEEYLEYVNGADIHIRMDEMLSVKENEKLERAYIEKDIDGQYTFITDIITDFKLDGEDIKARVHKKSVGDLDTSAEWTLYLTVKDKATAWKQAKLLNSYSLKIAERERELC